MDIIRLTKCASCNNQSTFTLHKMCKNCINRLFEVVEHEYIILNTKRKLTCSACGAKQSTDNFTEYDQYGNMVYKCCKNAVI